MRRVLAATDFSTHSDRAIRRATLIAKQFSAELFLVNVVSQERSEAIVKAERTKSAKLLQTICHTIRSVDGLACQTIVKLGEAYQGILEAVEEVDAELTIVGPHRRQLLVDTFVGTTAERIIRFGVRPVLMANGLPANLYRRVLLALDLSPCSTAAVRAVAQLGLDKQTNVTVVHAFSVPSDTIISRGGITTREMDQDFTDARERARQDLSSFLQEVGYKPAGIVLRAGSPAEAIRFSARMLEADLIVVGTHGRRGVDKLLWGSVAQEIAYVATCDVLTVPPHSANAYFGAPRLDWRE
ncbi:MAG TPA: universal stress protein [Pyrinomonadaceae bacterium]|nr:universal stress protein [Pyrinomonadaceae bacterium]